MLKIKDNIDLKELQKFGFKKRYSTYKFSADYKYNNRASISINGAKYSTRKIFCDFWEINDETLDKIFDLIQADLVEKVETD